MRSYASAHEALFPVAVAALRAATATGNSLAKEMSAPPGRSPGGSAFWALVAAMEQTRLLNFLDLLWAWGGRLHLGERLITQGYELCELRFQRDEGDFLEHLYGEALERSYALVASDDPPIDDAVRLATRLYEALMGEELGASDRTALTTTVIRVYLYRSVENDPRTFLEPKTAATSHRPWVVSLEPLG